MYLLLGPAVFAHASIAGALPFTASEITRSATRNEGKEPAAGIFGSAIYRARNCASVLPTCLRIVWPPMASCSASAMRPAALPKSLPTL